MLIFWLCNIKSHEYIYYKIKATVVQCEHGHVWTCLSLFLHTFYASATHTSLQSNKVSIKPWYLFLSLYICERIN